MSQQSKELIVLNDPKSPISEAYRTIRTNIQFANIDKNIKTIAVASPIQGEGKTLTISNIAITLANQNKKVMLIDCDMRRPRIHKIFGLTNIAGVSDIVLENEDFHKYLHNIEGVPNLQIITAGRIPPNPSEILSSQRIKHLIEEIKQEYDYVLMDAPAVLAVTDTSIISTYVDGIILVCSSGRTEIVQVKQAKEALDKVGANILGAVLNKFKIEKGRGYYYYQSYYYYYYGEDDHNKKKKTSRIKK